MFGKIEIQVNTMTERKVDLLVLEGMGRAIHTNLYAKFNCECLKVEISSTFNVRLFCAAFLRSFVFFGTRISAQKLL
jgi:hypothetical protein